ncbi:MAG: ABC transporter ATP-binding protein [Deltaproteobacteria bacterium]|nr:ABC transporter ATP-binding protein [Deltaproteobacteria bacterium]
MTTPAIEVTGLNKSFGATPALEDVHLTCDEGELLGVIGPNGGGKTVLLRIILGLIAPDSGMVRVFGQSPEKARGLVGYVPQHAGFDHEFPINVRDVVLTGRQIGGRLLRRYENRDRELASQALGKVDMLEYEARQIGKLSGGQLQRVLIARALVTQPRLLLLDEPTANLDPSGGHSLYELLAKLVKELTVVIVSHDIGVISGYVTSTACVNRRLLQHAGPEPPRDMVEKTYNCPVHFIPPRSSDCGADHSHGEEEA